MKNTTELNALLKKIKGAVSLLQYFEKKTFKFELKYYKCFLHYNPGAPGLEFTFSSSSGGPTID